jgi:hypothetical protein
MFILIQSNLEKCKIWPKKFGKGRQEWNKVCEDSKICFKKLNIPIKTKVKKIHLK